LIILVIGDFALFGGDINILQRFDGAAQPTIPEDENSQSTTRFLNGRNYYS
jgi:type II restriction/modification system DNA methylase subunit YeeA